MIKFRNLVEDEIECRVQSVTDKSLVLLLYKNARCDMNILDETVGAMNWQREHYECKGNLFCRVGIYFDCPDFKNVVKSNICGDGYDAEHRTQSILKSAKGGQWIYKSDCGAESNTEKEKGEASDSFKRACVNWGIGRELYTAPLIRIPLTDKNGKPNYSTYTKNGKPATYDKFAVEKIVITEDKKITGVAIRNTTQNKRVFIWSIENGN